MRTVTWILLIIGAALFLLVGLESCSASSTSSDAGNNDGMDAGGDGQELTYPVKILFVIDDSGSMQELDSDNRRVEAVRSVVQEYTDDAGYTFGAIGFSTLISGLTNGFVDLDGTESNVFGPLGAADGMTDMDAALGTALQMLENDMLATDAAELARTKYVVLFFSDGTPDPICHGCVTDPPSDPDYSPDCHPDKLVVCRAGADPDFLGECPDAICGTPDKGTLLDLDQLQDGMLSMMKPGEDYNDYPQIIALADAISALKAEHQVGDVVLDAGYLNCYDASGNPGTARCDEAMQAYKLIPAFARKVMTDMVAHGNGSYHEFVVGQGIDLLQFDFSPLGP